MPVPAEKRHCENFILGEIMITRDMTIEEILSSFPQKSQLLAQQLTNAGLSCVGCSASTWETLEAGMLSHGYEEEEIEDLLDDLNSVLEEEFDLTTITMTKRAAEKFREILKEEGKEGWALRLSDRPGGCSGFEYILDFSKQAKEGDFVFSSEGVNIHVGEHFIERLLGCEVDYVDGLQGAGFKVTNPNVRSSCGCGKSQNY